MKRGKISRDLESIKNNQKNNLELKSMSEINTSLHGLNRSIQYILWRQGYIPLYTVKTRLVDLNTAQFEISKLQHGGKECNGKNSRKDMWEIAKRSHINVLEGSEWKGRDIGTEANI